MKIAARHTELVDIAGLRLAGSAHRSVDLFPIAETLLLCRNGSEGQQEHRKDYPYKA
jgi:hypothetical protein